MQAPVYPERTNAVDVLELLEDRAEGVWGPRLDEFVGIYECYPFVQWTVKPHALTVDVDLHL